MKQSKPAVHYSRGHKDSHCGQTFDDDKGYCKFFVSRGDGPLGACKKVQGSINRVYWCELFSKAK